MDNCSGGGATVTGADTYGRVEERWLAAAFARWSPAGRTLNVDVYPCVSAVEEYTVLCVLVPACSRVGAVLLTGSLSLSACTLLFPVPDNEAVRVERDGSIGDGRWEDASESSGPTFVGSRMLMFDSPPVSVLSPAGVRPSDLLLAAWLSGPPQTSLQLPDGWVQLGATAVGDPNNGGVAALVVGYHVMSNSENDDTHYLFQAPPGASHEVAVIAYRNAGRKQPVTPATVLTLQTTALGGGAAALDVPPLDTRGVTLPVYVFAIKGSTTYPVLSNFDRVEATGLLGVYRARTSSPPGLTLPGPHLEITVAGAAPPVMVASLAVVAEL